MNFKVNQKKEKCEYITYDEDLCVYALYESVCVFYMLGE